MAEDDPQFRALRDGILTAAAAGIRPSFRFFRGAADGFLRAEIN